jgi:RTX calcium-binding nonapeptide repeat (4 copies)
MYRAILAAITMASLAIPAVGVGVTAAATCEGVPATIEGTPGDDETLSGTSGRDIVALLGGNDLFLGKGGRDLICGGDGIDDLHGEGRRDRLFGGSGNDSLFGGAAGDDLFGFGGRDSFFGEDGPDFAKGGAGNDRIFGADQNDILHGDAGNDTISGGQGNDTVDGGPGIDDCTQGGGSGPVRNCEKADLKVNVTCPANGGPGITTCQVKVKNRGPDRSSYTLHLGEGTVVVTPNCTPSGWSEDGIDFSPLPSGASRTRSYDLDCEGEGGSNRFEARVDADARDPRPGNNEDEKIIDFS